MTLMPFGIKAGQEPLSVKAHIPNDTKVKTKYKFPSVLFIIVFPI